MWPCLGVGGAKDPVFRHPAFASCVGGVRGFLTLHLFALLCPSNNNSNSEHKNISDKNPSTTMMSRISTLALLVAVLHANVAFSFVTPSLPSKISTIVTKSPGSKTLYSKGAYNFKHCASRPEFTTTTRQLAANEGDGKSNLPFWLDPGTKGGAVFLSIVLFIVPIIIYNIITNVFGADPIETGKWIGVGFTVVSIFVWVGTYIFRVATKDMTYVSFL